MQVYEGTAVGMRLLRRCASQKNILVKLRGEHSSSLLKPLCRDKQSSSENVACKYEFYHIARGIDGGYHSFDACDCNCGDMVQP